MKFEKILICGLGAIGSNTLLNVIRDLPEVEVWGLDFDKVDARNYSAGTQPYTKHDLNKMKTQAIQMISIGQAGVRVRVIDKKLENILDVQSVLTLLNTHNVLVVDAFDNAKARNLLHNVKFGGEPVQVLHAGFSPQMTTTIIWDEVWSELSPTKPADVDICTQQGARSFIMASAALTSGVISEYYFNDVKKNLYFDKSFNLKVLR
jgi:hypothetical protein